MPKYSYKAQNAAGKQISGEMDAVNETAVVESLRQQSMFVIDITLLKDKDAAVGGSGSKIPLKTMAVFCTQMATVLKAGVSLTHSLNIMKSQIEDKKFKKIIEDVSQSISSGKSMKDSFFPYRKQLPMLFLNMVEAGELSGTLDNCLERAGETFMKTHRLNSKAKGAMIYPSVLLVVTVLVFVAMMIFILPKFKDMFAQAGASLPAISLALMKFSDSLIAKWYIYLGVIVAIIVVFSAINSTKSGRTAFDRIKVTMPKVGPLQMKIVTARYARTLSTLSSAGLSLVIALEMSGKAVENLFVQNHIEDVIVAVKNGESLSKPLERGKIFPPMIIHMTRLGEESGSLESLLEKTAEFYEDESEQAIAKLMALLEPLIIILMAVVVLLIILAVMLPMLTMSSAFG